MPNSLGRYVWYMLRPFWAWWWASLTGVATLLSYFAITPDGVKLTQLQCSSLVLVLAVLLFLLVSICVQSWQLYLARHSDLRVAAIQVCQEYGGTHVFLLRGHTAAMPGTILEIRRPIGDVEAPFALLELLGPNTNGLFQANPLWIAPGHLSEFTSGHIAVGTLVVDSFVRKDRILTYLIDYQQRA